MSKAKSMTIAAATLAAAVGIAYAQSGTTSAPAGKGSVSGNPTGVNETTKGSGTSAAGTGSTTGSSATTGSSSTMGSGSTATTDSSTSGMAGDRTRSRRSSADTMGTTGDGTTVARSPRADRN